ncbi:hypothetical protein PSI22_10855 [Xenorhabdus sp. XENO-7]|uniref:Cytochrome P450 n=1 Tax=Xenorhabdus aichiensis TaxID=3025874 RepID=A0ABT5M375_9GAMM|nr:hypothetical protein [Xenorhabdus aichiensis]MDC9622124.1 hypothetical protein [Xenorhabdus aichiensis]
MKECPMKFKTLQEVKVILSDKTFTVRPKSANVPKEIEASCAGEIFSSLVRMRDDNEHEKLKIAVTQTLESFTEQEIYQNTLFVAKILYKKINSAESLTKFNYALSIYVIGHFLGIKNQEWKELVNKVIDFIQCISPSGDKQRITESIIASEYLYVQLEYASGVLLNKLKEKCLMQNITNKHVVISNAIGFFFQVSDSTTGLLGQMLIEYKKGYNNGVKILDEVLKREPPIKNTRRFKTEQGDSSSETLIVAPLRTKEGTLPFGYGHHRCPGEIWGRTIALAAFDFLTSLPNIDSLIEFYQWRYLPNAMIPEFITCLKKK